jgi:hypothetical protein
MEEIVEIASKKHWWKKVPDEMTLGDSLAWTCAYMGVVTVIGVVSAGAFIVAADRYDRWSRNREEKKNQKNEK